MFRLFRRGKKDKKKDKQKDASKPDSVKEVKNKTDSTSIQTPSEIQPKDLEDAPSVDTTYADKITAFSKTIAEGIPELIPDTAPEESEIFKPITEFHSMIKAIVESETSIKGFISPELLSQDSIMVDTIEDSYKHVKLVPISLEERIEGAMFSIGRPIHTSELIDNLQEESPFLKRTLRKLSKTRKRSAPIIFQEISKDRWVLQLNPIYHEFFYSLIPEKFMTQEERRILTEIAYRQPISQAMIKKIVKGIGPIKITEICQYLEKTGYVVSEKKARSLVYTSTPKFANDFGFDDESRRLKLQMLWRLKRLMGDYETEEEEAEEIKKIEEEEIQPTDQVHEEGQVHEEEEIKEIEEEEIQPTDQEHEEGQVHKEEEIKEIEEEEIRPTNQEHKESQRQKGKEILTSLEEATPSLEKEEELMISDNEGELEQGEDSISSLSTENISVQGEEILSPKDSEEE
jgi:chromosome segregation and condensation protein ScpB